LRLSITAPVPSPHLVAGFSPHLHSQTRTHTPSPFTRNLLVHTSLKTAPKGHSRPHFASLRAVSPWRPSPSAPGFRLPTSLTVFRCRLPTSQQAGSAPTDTPDPGTAASAAGTTRSSALPAVPRPGGARETRAITSVCTCTSASPLELRVLHPERTLFGDAPPGNASLPAQLALGTARGPKPLRLGSEGTRQSAPPAKWTATLRPGPPPPAAGDRTPGRVAADPPPRFPAPPQADSPRAGGNPRRRPQAARRWRPGP
jgi:hypothetical protein